MAPQVMVVMMMTVMIMVMMAIRMSSMVFEDDFGENICEDSLIMTMMVFKKMLVKMF